MKLHIFNPGHDTALANGSKYFTPPHAARQLMADMGYLPALWADDGDAVLVENAEAARQQARHFRRRLADVLFVEPAELKSIGTICEVLPWGWDAQLAFRLSRWGVDSRLLPSEAQLEAIRRLSSRVTAVRLLPQISTEEKAWMVGSTAEFHEKLIELGRVVAKEPWSSSGRGVRYITRDTLTEAVENWVRRVIATQGGLAVEPYYNKVVDFGMEFCAEEGQVSYRGLSVFTTENGFYTGNLVAREELKEALLARYVSPEILGDIRTSLQRLLGEAISTAYCGPLGVDMMIYADEVSRLHVHPMVEINLRRTMGHAALSLLRTLHGESETMSVEYRNNRYKLRITKNKPK